MYMIVNVEFMNASNSDFTAQNRDWSAIGVYRPGVWYGLHWLLRLLTSRGVFSRRV